MNCFKRTRALGADKAYNWHVHPLSLIRRFAARVQSKDEPCLAKMCFADAQSDQGRPCPLRKS